MLVITITLMADGGPTSCPCRAWSDELPACRGSGTVINGHDKLAARRTKHDNVNKDGKLGIVALSFEGNAVTLLLGR